MSAKIPRALSIAGSDSGGGAGIQADLKTFAALGVHGMTALTAITAQNTVDVTAVQDVDTEVIRAQIRAVADDIGVDAAKTGMLHTSEIIETVAEEVECYGFPLVVDPVMIAKSGAALLRSEAKDTLVGRLLPLATVVTPNAMEAEAISGVRIETLEDGKGAAEKISALSGGAVVVKGGHILQREGKAVDILFHEGEWTLLEAERFETKDTHGTGCSFASAVAAQLAKGDSIPGAVSLAKEFVNNAIRYGLRLGSGSGPLNPMANLWNDAERFRVISNLGEAVRLLESCPEMAPLVAEVQMNIGMALPFASTPLDVAAVEGRITRLGRGVRASGCPGFGVSGHVARTILAVRRFDDSFRAGMNLRYSPEAVEACKAVGLVVSSYDRREEPQEIKEMEGMTTYWGASEAVKKAGRVPDVIYHLGDWGKEPMITVVGRTAVEVAERAVAIARKLAE
ncbi:bifunctional hydroxymethylpyrimidine kinase/phosphomethylpyrimidine kinase [Candidatus Bathyarchaeota archaeon]|nr:bifunctional hydroxymethylpyrimidine kinase/phosphomethylpyrimidine kinase [Candidatus Bathyarchaeota archaeon]